MYGSHDMRHTGFRRLTVVNETPGNWGDIHNKNKLEENKNKKLKIHKHFFTSNILYLYSYFYVKTNILKYFILKFSSFLFID